MKVFHYSLLESSQLEAIKLSKQEPGLNNFIVIADEQTKGFGKRGAKWASPKGNIYCSFTFCLEKELDHHSQANNFYIYNNPDISTSLIKIKPIDLHFAITIAVFNTVKKVIDTKYLGQLFFKWPNDIFLAGKKLSGIITEVKDSKIFIGVGINSNFEPFGLESATCLKSFVSINSLPINNIDFVSLIYKEFCETIKAYGNNQQSIYQQVAKNLAFKNQKREVNSNKKSFLATILAINPDYTLEVLNHSTKKIENLDSAVII